MRDKINTNRGPDSHPDAEAMTNRLMAELVGRCDGAVVDQLQELGKWVAMLSASAEHLLMLREDGNLVVDEEGHRAALRYLANTLDRINRDMELVYDLLWDSGLGGLEIRIIPEH